MVFGASLVAAAAGGVMWASRRARRQRSEDSALRAKHDSYVNGAHPAGFSLDDEIERMEGEGGDPGATTASGADSKRFVRSNGSGAAAR